MSAETDHVAKMNALIRDQEFSEMDLKGFSEEPRLALLTGATLGYGLRIDEEAAETNDLNITLQDIAETNPPKPDYA